MNLFVARLNSSTTGDDLLKIFSQYGEVTSAKVIIDRETGNSKGFGFVEMPNDDEAKQAISALNDSELDGKQIVVKEANDKSESGPRKSFQGNRPGGFQNRGGGGGFQRRDDNRGPRREFRSDDRRGGGGGGNSTGGPRRNDNRPRSGGYDSGERYY